MVNQCSIPGCLTAAITLPGGGAAVVTTTITYTYDSLNRLAAADYDSGEYFHYTYDDAGNRLTEEKKTTPAGPAQTTSYTYDDANRMTSAGGVAYTWDDNGNLLNDGISTYTYNHANRLTMVDGPASVVVFTYNGLGDRLSETINGVTTIFTLDLNAGLTQVLSDGTHLYLYGLGRIAQTSATESVYFLGDALGSVRQLADGQGTVVLAQSYEPYGSVLKTAGENATKYGYTGEWQENGLVFLRARYYRSIGGIFNSHDLWSGDYHTPISYSSHIYGYDNPARYTDHSGLFISEGEEGIANKIATEVYTDFGVTIDRDWGFYYYSGCNRWRPGRWSIIELELVQEALSDLAKRVMINNDIFKREIGPITLRMTPSAVGRGVTYAFSTLIDLEDKYSPASAKDIIADDSINFDKWTIVHEFGHAWDRSHGGAIVSSFERFTGGYTMGASSVSCDNERRLPGCNAAGYVYGGKPPKGSDDGFTRGEDFAESVAATVYPGHAETTVAKYVYDFEYFDIFGNKVRGNYRDYLYYVNYHQEIRYSFVYYLVH